MWNEWLARIATSQQKLAKSRLLTLMGPALHHPRLWRTSRQSVARGAAIGVFFGLLLPLAQIPAAALASVPLRANVGAAVASTLVTNPITFAPIYIAAYRVGSGVLSSPARRSDERALHEAIDGDGTPTPISFAGSIAKPLATGLVIFSCSGAVIAYLGVTLLWEAVGQFRPVRSDPDRGDAPDGK